MSVYKVAIFGDGAKSHATTLQATLEKNASDLGVPSAMLSFLDEISVPNRDRKSPKVGVYFGLSSNPLPIPAALTDLLSDDVIVLPVVQRSDRFTQYVPPELQPISGSTLELRIRVGAHCRCVHGGLGLLRRSRRLFISYRRVETQSIAIQLYESNSMRIV